MLCGVQECYQHNRELNWKELWSALGRAVGNISACKHLKIQAKEVGRLRHGLKGSTTTGECFKIPKMEHKKTTHAIKKKPLRKSNGLIRSDVN